MEAKELRIGNWINHPENYAIEVNSTTIDLMSALKNNRFNPVPLTEEILLKAGFEKKGWQQYLKMKISEYNSLWYFDGIISILCEGLRDYDDLVTIKLEYEYLHQLQNLYYALTGEELEIDLNK